MKTTVLTLLIFLSFSLQSQVPFGQLPSFETEPLGHIATGLGIADINGDGWKDIIVANGNDIHRQHLVVYYNNGDGSFPSVPSWQSDDIDYHGHLSAGDIDLDGDIDIAVSVYIGPAGFSSPGRVKVYYNQGNELEATPTFQSEEFYSFSCTLGDADGDGDLDLAVACGEPYSSLYDKARIYYNDNGAFSESNKWLSDNEIGGMDVEFGDVDENGFLDLVIVSEETANYIFLADDNGNIDTEWDWHSEIPENYMNSVDFGKVCVTCPPSFVTTGNNQLGGDGKIKQFLFTPPIGQSSPPDWESNFVGYGSGILMAEVNNDGFTDLLYGSWWGPLRILEGNGNSWLADPIYTASKSSVVEAILMSDLGRVNYQQATKTLVAVDEISLVYLDRQVIEQITEVRVNGEVLDRSEYCYVELKNWISLKNNLMPNDQISINYDYMLHGDIVITNWDSGKGNFIYYNTNNTVGISEYAMLEAPLAIENIYPQPADHIINITLNKAVMHDIQYRILDVTAKELYNEICQGNTSHRISVSQLTGGIYIIEVSDGVTIARKKFIKAR